MVKIKKERYVPCTAPDAAAHCIYDFGMRCVKLGIPITAYAGPEFPVDLSIASPFSRQIAIGNAGPAKTLESIAMGPKQSFRWHFLNIGPSFKQ